ncbi:type VI secretion system tip protein VgrG [Vibrio aestuarianus]|uniref:type VI secretion system Vgr family protein n=1 Tax=Vibrio aestuarianus TaxID=28171 RepID=UPI00237D1536|nr:type VI secretion system tip protein TssI/VgrG [Vibrio aestuarianus]MDE1319860.1 type VI secretion system tip protein VgrG [Vibrio aestuarianus]
MSKSELSYSNRSIVMKLANNRYVVSSLESSDTISQGSRSFFSVASNREIAASNLGEVIHVSYTNHNNISQTFLGLVTSIELIGYSVEKSLFYYTIEAQDPLSLLAFRYNRKIYQEMTSKQILSSLFGASKFSSYFKFSVSGSGKKHDYCVQLDETDLQFAQRLLSQEGWHYHVDHSGSKPVVVIADSNQAFKVCNQDGFIFNQAGQPTENQLSNWKLKSKAGTGKLTLADHSQTLAEVFDSGERKSTHSSSSLTLDSYQYGLGFESKSEIRDAAKTQMEALDSGRNEAYSSTSITNLYCGGKFKLSHHPVSSFNQDYVITSITHKVSADESGRKTSYENQFLCTDLKTAYRPSLMAVPTCQHIHTATVCGPKNEEIYRDKLGRVKVQFHWDNDGKRDENASCWLPVSQGLASKGFGSQFLPRVGDEVLIQYIEGNPNRPVIIGSIYNKANAPAYSSATQSGIKTRSTPKGSSKQGNELRFEDQKDKEHIYLHAEKDLLIDTNNDLTTTVKGKVTSKVEKTIDVEAKENIKLATEKQLDVSSKDNLSAKSDKNITLDSGSNLEAAAKSSVKVDGNKVSITGKSKIELKVGASKIEISASGIKIDAPQVSIAGKGKAEMKAAMVSIEGQGKTDVKGALVTLNGSAMTQVKAGAMVQIQGAIAKVN